MATALDLLMSSKEDVNLLSEESDICTIDAKTRAIFVPSTIVVGGVQSDKNAERIKFSCPKIVGDNLDLSKFSVRINFENVSSVDSNVSIKDQYICDDVAVDGENVTFSWLIGRNAARYMGTVRFIVCAVKTDSDSNISVEWNTAIAEVPVLEGIEIDQPQIGQEEKDVINQLLELTKNTSAEAVQNVNSAKEQAIKDIQSVSQPDTTLTIEGGLAEAKATGEAIGSLREDLVGIVNSEIVETTITISKSTDGIELKDSFIIGVDGAINPFNAYYTYVYKLKNDGKIYFADTPTNSAVLMFAVYDGYPSASTFKGTRYRLSDNNLPKSNNKLSVSKDQYIAVSCYLSVSASSLYFTLYEDISTVGDRVFGDVRLNQNQIKQINRKQKCHIKYVSGNGLDDSTEKIEIYTPTLNGFIRYDLLHCINATKNSNVWRMGYAYKVDDNFENEESLTIFGEWECALHLNNSGDYSGGIAHGNEILDDVVFFVDSCKVNISDITDILSFDNFTVVSATKMYDSTDSTRLIAEHGCEHIFTVDGLNIKQSVEWKSDEQLTWCYMAMNLPKKSIVNKYYTNRKIVPRDIEYGLHNKVNDTVLFGDNVSNAFSVDKYPSGMSGGDTLLVADNGGNPYVKCYYVICSSGSVTSGTIWESSTRYKFDSN